jgi:hypothetical protein
VLASVPRTSRDWRESPRHSTPPISMGRNMVSGAHARFLAILLAVLPLHYFGLVSLAAPGLTLDVPSQHGLTYNSMALRLLEGRFDVDPAVIGDEGFFRNGRTYAYFGIFPALLRIPLVPFTDLATVLVEGVYRYAAMLIAASGGIAMIVTLERSFAPADDTVTRPLLIAAALSGPSVMLAIRPGIFEEATLWAWALCAWFLTLLLPTLRAGAQPSVGRLCALALLAGLCLLTRPTTGLGLLLALGLLLLSLLQTEAARKGSPGITGALRGILSKKVVLPALIVCVLGAVAAGVNYARWGDPFVFADLRLQHGVTQLHPDRLERLEQYGLFNPTRLGLGILYYFFPIWSVTVDGRFLFHDQIVRLFDAFELPPSSFFLSDPLTMFLAAIGLAALLRGRLRDFARGRVLVVLAGLSIAPALMLIGWYMAFRYRAEFMPLFLLAACLGAVSLGHSISRATARQRAWTIRLLWALLAMQLASAHAHAVLYAISPYGPSHRFATEGLGALYLQRPATR